MPVPVDGIDLNPFAVAVTVAGILLGPKLAVYVGGYALILIGWFVGLMFGLFRRRPDQERMPVWAFTLCTLGISLCTTVPLSEYAAQHLPFSPTVLLFPVAFVIPAFPDRWSVAGRWVVAWWLRIKRAGRVEP